MVEKREFYNFKFKELPKCRFLRFSYLKKQVFDVRRIAALAARLLGVLPEDDRTRLVPPDDGGELLVRLVHGADPLRVLLARVLAVVVEPKV